MFGAARRVSPILLLSERQGEADEKGCTEKRYTDSERIKLAKADHGHSRCPALSQNARSGALVPDKRRMERARDSVR